MPLVNPLQGKGFFLRKSAYPTGRRRFPFQSRRETVMVLMLGCPHRPVLRAWLDEHGHAPGTPPFATRRVDIPPKRGGMRYEE